MLEDEVLHVLGHAIREMVGVNRTLAFRACCAKIIVLERVSLKPSVLAVQ